MSELALKNKVVAMIRREYPKAFFYKPADRFTSGIPDIVGCLNGYFFAIELKFGKGKVTRLQEYVLRKILTSGGRTCVAYSVEDVRNFFEGKIHQII